MSSLDSKLHTPDDRPAESQGRAALASLFLHGGLVGAFLLWTIFGGFLHRNTWGGPGAGQAVQVQLVSSALPLPADQKPNDNVLATETPSQAPAEQQPKAKEEHKAEDEKALAISSKQKPAPKPTPRSQPQKTPQVNNRANYGEQASSQMQRAVQNSGANSPTNVNDGDFGSRFGWYVDGINRKMATSWNKGEVDPRTPKGTRVFLIFTIHRDGSPTNVTIDRSSGSPTLDRSCLHGVQRIDSFGQLPAAYNASTLKVSYYCEY